MQAVMLASHALHARSATRSPLRTAPTGVPSARRTFISGLALSWYRARNTPSCAGVAPEDHNERAAFRWPRYPALAERARPVGSSHRCQGRRDGVQARPVQVRVRPARRRGTHRPGTAPTVSGPIPIRSSASGSRRVHAGLTGPSSVSGLRALQNAQSSGASAMIPEGAAKRARSRTLAFGGASGGSGVPRENARFVDEESPSSMSGLQPSAHVQPSAPRRTAASP